MDLEFIDEAEGYDVGIFPILYNEEKGRKWKIWIKDNLIYRTDGLSSKEFIKKPSCREAKAKAHTSAEEQALLDAKKSWTQKLDQGFVPAPDDEEGQEMYREIMNVKKKQGGNNHGTSRRQVSQKDVPQKDTLKGSLKHKLVGVISDIDVKYPAMLAHKYNEKEKRVLWNDKLREEVMNKLRKITKTKYKNMESREIENLVEQRLTSEYFDASNGAFVQTKLDGVRCISFLSGSDVVCFTRNSKQFVHLQNQRKEISKFLRNSQNVVLDGEWYVHKPIVNDEELQGNSRFDFISSCCRTSLKNPNDNEHLIEYHVYDIVDSSKTQTERLKILKKLFSTYKGKTIVPVRIHVVTEKEDIDKWQNKFFKDDYEGVILRNPNAFYEGKRVLHLLKYKLFDDGEFIIVGAATAEGTETGAVIWICEAANGTTFKCRMTGKFEKRIEMYDNYTDYLGLPLTVKYQGLGKDNIPRFPIGIAIRQDE